MGNFCGKSQEGGPPSSQSVPASPAKKQDEPPLKHEEKNVVNEQDIVVKALSASQTTLPVPAPAPPAASPE
jgi:hypothetical protein